MADELSKEELDALNALTGNYQTRRQRQRQQRAVPLSYDFRQPTLLGPAQTRLLENLHEQFARALSGSLSGALRLVAEAQLAGVGQSTFHEFLLGLSQPCVAYTFAVEPPGGGAVLSLAPDLVSALVDRAFGGRGLAASTVRDLTPLERGLVNKLALRLLDDLQDIWKAIEPVTLRDSALETNAEFIQIVPPGDGAVVVDIELNARNISGLIQLCYPLSTLDPLLPKQTAPKRPAAARPAAPRRSFDNVQIPVTVQLAAGHLPLKALADLTPGDIVRLETQKDEPAIVFLGERPKFFARPGLDGRHRAVRLTDPIPAADEEAYR